MTDSPIKNASRILAGACLSEPWAFYLVADQVSAQMFSDGDLSDKTMMECMAQHKKFGKYTIESISTALCDTPEIKSELLKLAAEGAGADLAFAFDVFYDMYGQKTEMDIAQKIPYWVSQGQTSTEIIINSEKTRREAGLNNKTKGSDGKAEFEAKLTMAYEGIIPDYPVKPFLEKMRALIPHYEGGDYIVVVASTGNGKSYYALNQLFYLGMLGIPCTYINLENTPANVQKRLWQMRTGQGFKNDMSARGQEKIKEGFAAWEEIKAMPINSMNPGPTLGAVVSAIRREKVERGTMFAVVDYVQLMNIVGYRGGRNYELGDISAALKTLTLELNIPIVALAQAKQEVSKTADKRPGMYDVKDCANFTQDATYVKCLYRPSYWNIGGAENNNGQWVEYPPNYADILIDKGRETGKGLCEARFNPVLGFYDVPPEPVEPSNQIILSNRTEPDFTPF